MFWIPWIPSRHGCFRYLVMRQNSTTSLNSDRFLIPAAKSFLKRLDGHFSSGWLEMSLQVSCEHGGREHIAREGWGTTHGCPYLDVFWCPLTASWLRVLTHFARPRPLKTSPSKIEMSLRVPPPQNKVITPLLTPPPHQGFPSFFFIPPSSPSFLFPPSSFLSPSSSYVFSSRSTGSLTLRVLLFFRLLILLRWCG